MYCYTGLRCWTLIYAMILAVLWGMGWTLSRKGPRALLLLQADPKCLDSPWPS